jgi:hypothetical protein
MWDGTRFLAGGAYSTNQFAYSLDGFNWTIGSGFSTIFQDDVAGIALNIERPNRIVFPANQKTGNLFMTAPTILNEYGPGLSNRLDVSVDNYYNTGFNNMTMKINLIE